MDFGVKIAIYLSKKCHTILRIHNFDKIEGGKPKTFIISKPKIMLQYCMQFFTFPFFREGYAKKPLSV